MSVIKECKYRVENGKEAEKVIESYNDLVKKLSETLVYLIEKDISSSFEIEGPEITLGFKVANESIRLTFYGDPFYGEASILTIFDYKGKKVFDSQEIDLDTFNYQIQFLDFSKEFSYSFLSLK